MMLKKVNRVLLISVLVAMSGNAAARDYLSGIQSGQAYRDRNGNGIGDDSEPVTWADSQGNFTLAAGKGRLYLNGGNNLATGLANRHLLTAPTSAGSVGILTTFWQALLDRRHSKFKIATELNLPIRATPVQVKKISIDRLVPGTTAVTLLARDAQLQNLLSIFQAMTGLSNTAGISAASMPTAKQGTKRRPVEDTLVGIIADALDGVLPSKRRDWQALDLADADTVKRILAKALTNLSLTAPAATDLDAVAQSVASLNALIDQAGPSTPDVLKTAMLRGIVVARLVTEGRYAELGAATSGSVPLIVAISPDTGESDRDGITSDWSPTISGVASEGAAGVRLSFDNGMTRDAELSADGQWRWRLDERLADGSYRCTAVGIGANGSESEPSPAMTLVFDTTPPDAATVNTQTTQDVTPTLTGTWSPTGNTLAVTVNRHTYGGSAITTTDTTWSLTIPADQALPSGLYDVSTRVTDLAGNVTPNVASGALLIRHEFSQLFGAPSFVDVGPNLFSAKLADFNHDDKLDLAVTGGFPSVSILPGKGNGAFEAAVVTTGIDSAPFTMTLGNLDNDGNPDLLVGSFLLRGNGDFSFALKHLDQVGGFELADLNGDGLSDLVGIHYPEETYVNGGNASFLSTPSYRFDGSRNTCAGLGAAGDLNSDGKTDIVHLNSGGCIAVQLGDGKGALKAPANYLTGFMSGYGIVLHDMNNDGRLDIVATTSTNGVLLNKGRGRFAPPSRQVDTRGNFIAVDDFDGDGDPDIALTRGSSFVVLMNTGNGSFSDPYTFPVGAKNLMGIVSGDLNGDGRPDLVMTDFGTEKVLVLLNQGN